ncbi:MAG: hypothetical protein FWC89_01545 [Defluviitaleaceae bacterium]|nr:hypothetical protein [Defluviitaleaceae bacterium]
MEKYNSRTIDELGRFILPNELRKMQGFGAGDKIALTLADTIVVLHRPDSNPNCTICKIDELGMVELPHELRQKLGWKTKDQIALYYTDNILILKSAGNG